MAIQVASLYGLLDLTDNLTPKLEEAKTGLSSFGQTLGSKLQEVGRSVTQIGLGMTLLGAPFLAFAGTSIQAASESQLALTQLDAVLKSTGGAAGMTKEQLLNMATELQKTTRYSDEATIKGEAMLLTFTNIGSDVFPQAVIAIQDVSTAMGQDLQSSAIQVGKALNDPVHGMTALQRIGVTFSQSQKDAIKALVDTGDTAGAQKIILAELTKEFGGSAEAAGTTFPGKLDILKNKFDQVQEKIGSVMIDILTPLLDTLSDLATGFGNLPQPMQETIVKVVLIGAAMAIAGPIIAGVGTAITLLGGAIGLILSPAGILILLITGIVFALNSLYPGGLAQLLRDAAQAAQQLAAIFMGALAAAAQWVKDRFNELITTIQSVIEWIQGAIDKIGEFLGLSGGAAQGPTGDFPAGAGIYPAAEGSGQGALGIPDVNRTGLYLLHRGERVLSPTEAKSQQGGMTFTGPITVVANNPQEFEQKLRARYRARGN